MNPLKKAKAKLDQLLTEKVSLVLSYAYQVHLEEPNLADRTEFYNRVWEKMKGKKEHE